MFEKVNPEHPDKIADRIAGAIVDKAYTICDNPKIAIEVLLGHGECYIISESSVDIPYPIVLNIVERITNNNNITVHYFQNPQDRYLAGNQEGEIRCGDNGIFKGIPTTGEQEILTETAQNIYEKYKTDGKYVLDNDKLTICQSHANEWLYHTYSDAIINPLGEWTGGVDVDCGATNRKLGSDMGDGITGGGLHGKDLSKADVSINIYAHLKAQAIDKPVELSCAIGDTFVDGKPYSDIVKVAKDYINKIGGFEKFAEWGLIR